MIMAKSIYPKVVKVLIIEIILCKSMVISVFIHTFAEPFIYIMKETFSDHKY